jgi:putative FmdB family regulatory protein
MPIYEYKCDKGHLFEVIQRMTDEPVTECEECGATVVRVLHSPAVHFKGSGFYNTDYGKKKKGGNGGGASEGGGESEGGGDSKDSSDSKPSESKPSPPKSSDTKSGDSAAKAATGD